MDGKLWNRFSEWDNLLGNKLLKPLNRPWPMDSWLMGCRILIVCQPKGCRDYLYSYSLVKQEAEHYLSRRNRKAVARWVDQPIRFIRIRYELFWLPNGYNCYTRLRRFLEPESYRTWFEALIDTFKSMVYVGQWLVAYLQAIVSQPCKYRDRGFSLFRPVCNSYYWSTVRPNGQPYGWIVLVSTADARYQALRLGVKLLLGLYKLTARLYI